MKDFSFHRWIRLILQAGIIYLSPLQGSIAFAADKNILILKSSNNAFFDTSIEQLKKYSTDNLVFNTVVLNQASESDLKDPQLDLIITLGGAAAEKTRKLNLQTTVLHSYLTSFQYKSNSYKENHFTLLLEQPLQRYVDFINLLLKVNTIGVIKSEHNKISSAVLVGIQLKTAQRIEQKIFAADDNPVNTVRNLLQKSDVLLSLPSPNVYNRQSLKGILLASYRLNKPVISYSPSHVKSGALAAIFTSPANIGKQLAELTNKIISGETGRSQFFYARDFEISINQQVAKSLNLDVPDKALILEQLHKLEVQ